MKEYMSVEELAEYLGVNMETVNGFFPPPPSFKLGEFLKYKRSDIDNWVNELNVEQGEQKMIQAETLREKAKLQIREKNYEESRKVIRESLLLEPKSPDAHFYYGYSLVKLEKWAEAEFELRKALKLNSKGEWRDEATYQITICQKALGTYFSSKE
ncbi:MAG: tetratricopeptide repeat protein [Candidatus Wallbacteria bacterium]